jgi:hypothetical protein
MVRDAGAVDELAPAGAELEIPAAEVRRLAGCGPDHRWDRAAEAAIAEARRLLVPRARCRRLAGAELGGLFDGGTPVEAIARRGESWAFLATVGASLEGRVRERLASGEFLEGLLLDAAGSAAVEAICDRIEARLASGLAAARFSPGYCGWNLQAQRSLFALLRPEGMGVRLLPSLLMQPLKSVSGIVVRAAAADLEVPAESCEDCDARGCVRRRAGARGRIG